MSSISDNIIRIDKEIKSGKSPDALLLAVSKKKPVSDILEAYGAGVRDFGENYVQELTEKIPQLPGDIRWHMIGRLQTNKVKYIIGKVVLIHSVDSEKLAEKISDLSIKAGIRTDILVEINIAGEESKAGIKPGDAESFIRSLEKYEGIRVCGLMTSAPICDDPEDNREYFREMKSLFFKLQNIFDIDKEKDHNISMRYLSMGMTGDYLTALDEGSNIVRVGTGIFGERVY